MNEYERGLLHRITVMESRKNKLKEAEVYLLEAKRHLGSIMLDYHDMDTVMSVNNLIHRALQDIREANELVKQE